MTVPCPHCGKPAGQNDLRPEGEMICHYCGNEWLTPESQERYDNALAAQYEKRVADATPAPKDVARASASGETEVERLREALTPSAETKAAYMGEFKFPTDGLDYVPWTTIKQIMAAIRDRAALSPTPVGEVLGEQLFEGELHVNRCECEASRKAKKPCSFGQIEGHKSLADFIGQRVHVTIRATPPNVPIQGGEKVKWEREQGEGML